MSGVFCLFYKRKTTQYTACFGNVPSNTSSRCGKLLGKMQCRYKVRCRFMVRELELSSRIGIKCGDPLTGLRNISRDGMPGINICSSFDWGIN